MPIYELDFGSYLAETVTLRHSMWKVMLTRTL